MNRIIFWLATMEILSVCLEELIVKIIPCNEILVIYYIIIYCIHFRILYIT